jgi:hypothetical protein
LAHSSPAIGGEDGDGNNYRLQPQMLRRPEKRHSVQEADEERRVADRGQRATDVGSENDEENDHMGVMLSAFIGSN